MVPDRHKVWKDGRTEWTDGRTDDAKAISLRLRQGIKNNVFFLHMRTKYDNKRDFCHWRVEICVFYFVFCLPSPLTQGALYICYACSDISLSKGHLGSKGGKHLKTNLKTIMDLRYLRT